MRVDPPSTNGYIVSSSSPEPKGPLHPVAELSLAASLAVAAGLFGDWDLAMTVFAAVLAFFGSRRE